MAKVVTYLCDCCIIIYPLDELEAVQVYVFGNPAGDPKLVDYEMVCTNCRDELTKLMNKWISAKKPKAKTDVETFDQPLYISKSSA